jgi:hypothetical protein
MIRHRSVAQARACERAARAGRIARKRKLVKDETDDALHAFFEHVVHEEPGRGSGRL